MAVPHVAYYNLPLFFVGLDSPEFAALPLSTLAQPRSDAKSLMDAGAAGQVFSDISCVISASSYFLSNRCLTELYL